MSRTGRSAASLGRVSNDRRHVERRSTTRPEFVESWRKSLRGFKPVTFQSDAEPNARIDVWVARTDALLRARSCFSILTEADWGAVTRIRAPSSRHSAMTSRVLLRLGLSRAVDHRIAPSDWRFHVAEHGKPIVTSELPAVNFSVSHVDDFAVVAVSATLNIGVDVEGVDQEVADGVVANFCHPDEHQSVSDLPAAQKIREFVRFWTLKEAYTKMAGVGHSLNFNEMKFVLDPVRLHSKHRTSATSGKSRFETFYLSASHALYHVSLAIQDFAQHKRRTEVQIISLADDEGNTVF